MSGFSANIQDGARLDIAADGFWGSRFEQAFFDVKVFNPYAPSNQKTSLSTCYHSHENEKRGNRTNVSVQLNMALLLLLFSLVLVALGLKPQQAISAWPLCSLLGL